MFIFQAFILQKVTLPATTEMIKKAETAEQMRVHNSHLTHFLSQRCLETEISKSQSKRLHLQQFHLFLVHGEKIWQCMGPAGVSCQGHLQRNLHFEIFRGILCLKAECMARRSMMYLLETLLSISGLFLIFQLQVTSGCYL